MALLSGDSGGSSGARKRRPPMRVAPKTTMVAKPAPQRIAPQTTIQARPASRPVSTTSSGSYRSSTSSAPRPAPRPQPVRSNPPRPRPQGNNNNGGGGKPKAPNKEAPGKIKPQGKQGPSGVAQEKGKGIPKAPGLEQFLGSDATYQQTLSELMRTLEQYQLQNNTSQSSVREAFETALSRMGTERESALKNLEADFAARGLLNSGLYGDAVSQYNTQYGDRITDLTGDRDSNLSNLGTEFQNFQSNIDTQKADARLDAIRRRAEQYGLTG
jgi:hypothetical protein